MKSDLSFLYTKLSNTLIRSIPWEQLEDREIYSLLIQLIEMGVMRGVYSLVKNGIGTCKGRKWLGK